MYTDVIKASRHPSCDLYLYKIIIITGERASNDSGLTTTEIISVFGALEIRPAFLPRMCIARYCYNNSSGPSVRPSVAP